MSRFSLWRWNDHAHGRRRWSCNGTDQGIRALVNVEATLCWSFGLLFVCTTFFLSSFSFFFLAFFLTLNLIDKLLNVLFSQVLRVTEEGVEVDVLSGIAKDFKFNAVER